MRDRKEEEKGSVLMLLCRSNERLLVCVLYKAECLKSNHNSNLQLMPRGLRCSSVVEHLITVQWFIGSILHDGHIELFLFQASAA